MEEVMLGVALLVLLVQSALLALLVRQVPKVLKDLKESKAQWDLLVHKDPRVSKVLQDPPEHPVPLVPKANRGLYPPSTWTP